MPLRHSKNERHGSAKPTTTKETQPTDNKILTSDDDSTTKRNDNEKGTPTTNPYRQPKVAKRPQSPEPSFLFHLHVAVNHHHNHEIESTLPRLTEQALKTHLNDVFFHHSKREEPMWLQVHSVDFLETKQSPSRPLRGADNQNRSNKGSGHTSTFHVTLSPAPANDAFEPVFSSSKVFASSCKCGINTTTTTFPTTSTGTKQSFAQAPANPTQRYTHGTTRSTSTNQHATTARATPTA